METVFASCGRHQHVAKNLLVKKRQKKERWLDEGRAELQALVLEREGSDERDSDLAE